MPISEGFFWPKLQISTFFQAKKSNFFLPKKYRGGARSKSGGGGIAPPLATRLANQYGKSKGSRRKYDAGYSNDTFGRSKCCVVNVTVHFVKIPPGHRSLVNINNFN